MGCVLLCCLSVASPQSFVLFCYGLLYSSNKEMGGFHLPWEHIPPTSLFSPCLGLFKQSALQLQKARLLPTVWMTTPVSLTSSRLGFELLYLLLYFTSEEVSHSHTSSSSLRLVCVGYEAEEGACCSSIVVRFEKHLKFLTFLHAANFPQPLTYVMRY